ncbi:MAG: EF-hand domain-containing protein [Glycomyces artemisiae]|uniref:EF-hand domain-containing protein n=1 Tax=Glycomyces artemisiae TaxID=1076443 RepID=A0A850C8D5_9ACTN|nr:EF-hand domain-containing protein [Glycomyces artemisiae]
MTEDMLTAKIAHGFDHLDANGDGRLDQHDHIELGRRTAAELGHTPGSPEESWIISAYMDIWNGLHRPHLADGVEAIDKATFIASTRTLADDPAAADATVGHLARTFHAIADADASGDVGPGEFAAFSRAHFPNLPADEVDKAFAHLDRDGDGTLSIDEFVRAVVEYWSSTDPDAPGNWFMGRPVYER